MTVTTDTIARLRQDAVRLTKRIERVERALSGVEAEEHPTYPTIGMVLDEVAKRYGVSVSEMKSARRNRDITFARHIAMHLAKKLTLATFPMIGRAIGNRDHSTAMCGAGNIEKLRSHNSGFNGVLEHLEQVILDRVEKETKRAA